MRKALSGTEPPQISWSVSCWTPRRRRRPEPTPRFDLYRNPNQRAVHGLYLDVQSDLVSTMTRWCLPLFQAVEGTLLMTRAQWAVVVDGQSWVIDTPNVLAVPKALLREHRGHLAADDQLRVETSIDFVLRGY